GGDVAPHRGGEQVGQKRARVPEEVPEGARPVLPGVPPVDGGQDQGRGRIPDEIAPGGAGRERRALIARPQSAQREITRAEVVDAGLEPRDLPGDDVDLGLVEGAGRGRRAEVDRLTARVNLSLREARRE